MVYSSIEGSNPSLSASSRQYPRSLSPVPVKTAGHGQGNDQGRLSRLTEPPVFRQNSASVSCAPVAQLDRAPGYELGGRAFESRSEEHTSELQSLMPISYAVFCL